MNQTATKRQETVVSNTVLDTIVNDMQNHSAIHTLHAFGSLLRKYPLSHANTQKFLASLWIFFEEVPTGIMACALNICDQYRDINPWESTSVGARILIANIDEFGLQDSHNQYYSTHHQLFLQLANRLGVSGTQLKNNDNIMQAGRDLAKVTRNLYRGLPTGRALGLHLASELTSSIEFGHFYHGFLENASHYGLSGKPSEDLLFFKIHTEVEPMHYAEGVKMINAHIHQFPHEVHDIEQGGKAFLDSFEALFVAFNQELFPAQ
jgi:pyrroloquinoline quinone (PQQ) biosynthesis protein C